VQGQGDEAPSLKIEDVMMCILCKSVAYPRVGGERVYGIMINRGKLKKFKGTCCSDASYTVNLT
jgi:hypothetical protein